MTATLAMPTATVARTYAESGWRIFPIRPRTKRPLVAHGSREATSDLDQVAAWWRRWPFANVGALVPAGLVVVDIDPRNGCTWTPDRFAATSTVATGGAGWHLYFRAPALVDLASHSETLPGVDLIRGGRQVILPPSIHPSGERYRWIVDVAPVALPGLIVEFFERRIVASATTVMTVSGYLSAARHGIVADLSRDATPGNRWRALTRASLRFRDLGLSVDDALADLLPVVPVAPDFTEAEARRTITGVWRRPIAPPTKPGGTP